jgi:hypothetical protein
MCTGYNPVSSGMHYTGNNLLARERVKHHHPFAFVGRQTETILINLLNGQGQFFGAGFMYMLRFWASWLSCHGIS